MFRSRPVAARALAFLTVAVVAITTAPDSPAWGTAPALSAALPSVSVSDISLSEGTGGTRTAVFTVTQDVAAKTIINFKTVDGTAKSPADYLARTGKIRFAGKKKTRTVSITVNADALHEQDETFSLMLTGATGAAIADGEAVATILDDDAPPDVSVAGTSSVPEGQTGDTTYASVDVTLSPASGLTASVDWSTADGSAAAGSDYSASSGTVSFAPGETTQTVLIPVTGDNATEGDETFTVDLSAPVEASIGTGSDVVTIVDNDPIPPGSAVLSVTGLNVREGKTGTTTLTYTVTRTDETTTAVSVDYETGNGTALAPTDYASTTGTLAFAASQTVATVDVTVNGDATLEHNETFFLSLLNPSLGAAIETGQATGTIVNDDTKTTVVVKVRRSKHLISARGRVSPARPGKRAVVKLYRRRSGSWVRLSTKRPRLAGTSDLNLDGFTDSRYAASFARPGRGRCKVVATLPATAKFSSSQAVKIFAC